MVEDRGVEPLTSECKSDVIPFHQSPEDPLFEGMFEKQFTVMLRTGHFGLGSWI